MTNGGISKLAAAQRQLDCAIRLLQEGEDPLAVHTLAYAACCILRDLFGESQTRQVLDAFELSLEIYRVPNFLKHANRDPRAILSEHSYEHTYITIALAIRLWKELGRAETAEILAFAKLDKPFEPGHKASETMKYVQHGPIADPSAAKPHIDALSQCAFDG